MTTKKKYTVHVTFSADTSYEVEAEDACNARALGDELACKQALIDLDFYADAHCAEHGWDEKEIEDPR